MIRIEKVYPMSQGILKKMMNLMVFNKRTALKSFLIKMLPTTTLDSLQIKQVGLFNIVWQN